MITIFLEKSLENMAVAEWAFENGHYNACANRAYYAMLQAALAALANVGVTPKTDVINHGWVQGTFARELINRRKIFPGMSSYLNDARFLRETADYKQEMLNQRKASQALRWARTMVEAIRKELEKE
ncbi:HEPN domain-containing protein [bacterium]|nr:HEPN domain-containing protein [bacterium]